MLRTNNCGELRKDHKGEVVTLCGWVQKLRDKGRMVWIDLRDRYGITQLVFEEGVADKLIIEDAKKAGREDVISITGEVVERVASNDKLQTGEIEIRVQALKYLNRAKLPPFLIEDETDGGEELRMKYRYLDLRRNPVRKNIEFRDKMMQQTRNYLSGKEFIEIETPVLTKSTPEGARDFVVPSRMNPGQFYALPQSPQTFKQLLMVSGFDRYFQLVKCFRDEDLRADRQPEFTQIDCEMSFVERQDVLDTFEGLVRHLFKGVLGVEIKQFPVMTYDEAMTTYGSDKPDVRFDMKFVELNELTRGKGFNVFDQAELVAGIKAVGCGEYTRKQLDELTDFARQPQVGAKGMVYLKCNTDGTFKSSVNKFYTAEQLQSWANAFDAGAGDLILILAGDKATTRNALNVLRLYMGDQLGLRKKDVFEPLWVVDFPLLEWDDESQRFHAMHHPFTSPNPDDMALLASDPGNIRANAYDMVINGVEIGGGSIRIHERELQQQMFKALGFSDDDAQEQFGFLLEAFQFGAPPHGGIAFGLDRICAVFSGQESIRDFIAFPKNTSGRDVMIDSPSQISAQQLKELSIQTNLK